MIALRAITPPAPGARSPMRPRVFETVRPFRGVEARDVAELVDCDLGPVRAAIAGRYLGETDGAHHGRQSTRL